MIDFIHIASRSSFYLKYKVYHEVVVMKLMHLSDLHLGKTLSGYSLMEDQKYILDRIIEITGEHQPDCILIAGDVFDRAAPSAEAVSLLDDFLTRLSAYHIPILMIAGNHDSPERIAYGGRIMQNSGIYLSPVYDGTVKSVTRSDAHGDVCFWLLPFLRPADVRLHFPDTKIADATDALRTVINSMQLDPSMRNVLIAHQFVTGAALSESEEIYCGNAEQVSGELFAPFEYTALGHLHRAQNVGSARIRYCGTPLKYAAAEAGSVKSVTFTELGEKGSEPIITTVPLVPLRDMQKLRGSFQELMNGSNENFVHILLTDETDVPDAIGKLRMRYPHLLGMDYERQRTYDPAAMEELRQDSEKDPASLFSAFFEQVLSVKMNDEQEKIIQELIKEIWAKEDDE